MRRIYIRKRALYTWQKEPYTSEAMENETHIHGQKSLKRMSKRDWYRLQKEPYTWEAPGVRYALQPTREWNLPSSETYIHDQKSPILTTKGALHPILGKPMATDTHCNRRDRKMRLRVRPIYMTKRALWKWPQEPYILYLGSPWRQIRTTTDKREKFTFEWDPYTWPKEPMSIAKVALYPIPGKPLATDTHCNRPDRKFAFEWDPYRWKKSPIAMTNGSLP